MKVSQNWLQTLDCGLRRFQVLTEESSTLLCPAYKGSTERLAPRGKREKIWVLGLRTVAYAVCQSAFCGPQNAAVHMPKIEYECDVSSFLNPTAL